MKRTNYTLKRWMLDITKQLVGSFLSNNYSRNFGKFPGNICSGDLRIQDTATDCSWKNFRKDYWKVIFQNLLEQLLLEFFLGASQTWCHCKNDIWTPSPLQPFCHISLTRLTPCHRLKSDEPKNKTINYILVLCFTS